MQADARRFLEAMLLATRQAGAVALHLQGQVNARRKEASSAEAAAVSVADLAAQDVLLLALHEAFPQAAVDAEEETEAVTLFPPPADDRPLVVVDPIDGSFNYLAHSADFAVMCGWLEQGRYQAAVVSFPALEETYWGLAGQGVWRQGPIGTPHRVHLPLASAEAQVLVQPGVPTELLASFAHAGLVPQTTRCSAVEALAPLTGRGRASWIAGPPDRQRGIGYFLVREAGGVVTVGGHPWAGEDPRELRRGGPTVAAGDAAVAALLAEAAAGALDPSRPHRRQQR